MISFLIKLSKTCIDAGISPADSDELKLKKSSLVLIPLIIGCAAFIWSILFISLGQYLPASIPLSYSIISAFNLWHYQRTKTIDLLQKMQMILVLLLPFFLMWSLGGFALGSYVMIWAFFAPVAALTYETKEKSLHWFLAFLALLAFSAIIDQTLIANHGNTMSQVAIELFFLLNSAAALSGIFFLFRNFIDIKTIHAHKRLEKEHQALLLKDKDLRASEHRFTRIAQTVPIGIFQADIKGGCIFINEHYQQITKIREEDALGTGWANYIYPDDRQMVFQEWDLSVKEKRPFDMEYRQLMPDGSFIWIFCKSCAEYNQSGEILSYLGTIQNITELRENKQSLKESELRFRQLAENIREVFWLSSPGWDEFFYISPAYEDVWGQNAEALYKNPRLWIEVVHPDDRQQVIDDITDNIKVCTEFREYRIIKPGGEILWVKATAYPIYDTDGTVVRIAGVAEDITRQKETSEQILHQAHYDALTDLPNRFLSLDRLTQLINEARRNNETVAILFLDLDDFKKINDSLGHEAGDKLLIEVANRLKNVIRSGDTVGRLGGDEFITLLGNLSDASDARPIAENIINSFRDAFNIDDRELMMTISVGISVFPEDGDDASELLRKADSAMYHSKGLGRNTYSYFTDEMNKEVSRRLALEEQMCGALERGEFKVLYQPKLDLNSSKIMGAEALLRWHNPALGHLSPIEFIPIAEQTGLIAAIGRYVLAEALKATRQWHQALNRDFCIAVNLSPRQFRDTNLVLFIEQTLRESGIAAHCLEMEITEGVLMSGHNYVKDTLDKLSDLGVSIAMDDFGTGYSSLSYLRKYPFTVLKIDRSFVSDVTTDSADRELTNASISMAHGLKLKVVAEGIETEEQLSTLKEMGCDLGQGYLFGKPVPEADFTEMLKSSLQ